MTCSRRTIGTDFQVKADEKAYEQSKIALGEALNMYDRLTKHTGPKLIKALEANVRAIEGDKFTQEAAFNLEKQRLERSGEEHQELRALCTDRRDRRLRQSSHSVRNGADARSLKAQRSARINRSSTCPTPSTCVSKRKVNESKLTFVHAGQAARIVIDAFADRPLKGKVSSVTAINTPLNASDVRIYYANVDITEGFADLRPGLSAEVVFLVDSRRDVTRVPLSAVRWVLDRGYVAVYDPSSTDKQKKWRWKEVFLGTQRLALCRGLERRRARREDRGHAARSSSTAPAQADGFNSDDRRRSRHREPYHLSSSRVDLMKSSHWNAGPGSTLFD